MYKKDEINKQGGKFVKKIINKQVLIRASRVENFEKKIKRACSFIENTRVLF